MTTQKQLFCFKNESQIIMGGELDTNVNLSCGCNVELWKTLTVTALQRRQGLPARCLVHDCDHDFSDNVTFHEWAEDYLKIMESHEGRDLYPSFIFHA